MNTNPKLKYFLDINLYNSIFCLIISLISGFLWGLLMFMTIGIIVGFFGFRTFKENEYFAYYNLGLTKKDLIKNTFLMNSLISFFLFLIYILF
jgi:hypothetical protein